jgi:hypothetical protein
MPQIALDREYPVPGDVFLRVDMHLATGEYRFIVDVLAVGKDSSGKEYLPKKGGRLYPHNVSITPIAYPAIYFRVLSSWKYGNHLEFRRDLDQCDTQEDAINITKKFDVTVADSEGSVLSVNESGLFLVKGLIVEGAELLEDRPLQLSIEFTTDRPQDPGFENLMQLLREA